MANDVKQYNSSSFDISNAGAVQAPALGAKAVIPAKGDLGVVTPIAVDAPPQSGGVAGPGVVVYDNVPDPGTTYYFATETWLSDDVELATAGDGCNVVYIELTIYGPAGAAPYDVTVEFIEGNPCDTGTPIPGSQFSMTIDADGSQVISHTYDPGFFCPNVGAYVKVDYSYGSTAPGWFIHGEAEVGFTADNFPAPLTDPDTGEVVCGGWFFNGDPYAGFATLIECEAPDASACCIDAATCEELSEADCLAAGGVWYPLQSCADVDCSLIACIDGEGSCFEDNGTPGCDQQECCEAVCAVDSFCCEVMWDATCAGVAIDICGFCEPGPNCVADTISEPEVIPSLPYTTTGNSCDCCDNYDEACPYTGSDAPDAVYAYTATADGFLSVDLCESGYDTKVFVYENGETPGAPLACNDDACSDSQGNPFRSKIDLFPVTAGNTYYIVVDGYGGDCGDYELIVDLAEDCDVICPPDSYIEDEPVCEDDYVDIYNGGCNSDPAVFETITCDTTICGTSGTYLFGGLNYRDTDWFELNLTTDTRLTWEGEAEFPLLLFVIDSGSGDCVDYSILGSITGERCTPISLQFDVTPGVYWLLAMPSVFEGWPCGLEYVATVTCEDIEPCDVVCPPDSYIEDEPICEDEWVDVWNGGCNSTPNVFETIALGDTVCGTSGTYLFGGSNYRDTDWFEVNITEATSVVWEAEAEFPLLIFVIDAGSQDCVDYVILGSVTANPCETATLQFDVQPGVHWFLVMPSVFTGWDCGVEYVATLSTGEPCDVECPPGAYIEDEPICEDEYVDIYNGGCNSTPNVFEPVECGWTVCGTSGTYLFGGSNYRDTDWFVVTLGSAGPLTWEAEAEFPLLIFIIQANSGDCVDYTILGSATANPCEVASLTFDVAAGDYWLFVAPSVFVGWPCGGEYVATVTCDGGGCPDDVTLLSAAPQDGIVTVVPGTPLIDARQPWAPDAATPRLGVGIDNSQFGGQYALDRDDRMVVDLGAGNEGLADCFALCETDSYPEGANSIASVTDLGGGLYLVEFARAATVEACTTIQYTGDGSYVTFVPLPGDLNGDGFSSSFEALDLINYLNGSADVRAWDQYSSDIDHSGETNSIDVLRMIDLFNGPQEYAPGWNEAVLPDCAGCP